MSEPTFLSATTRAKPKIADYPFTTLIPQLGVAKIHENELVIADIPGLIEGAHSGRGLGDKFLAHVERCKVLIHLIDANHENIDQIYDQTRNEVKLYRPEMLNKPEVIAINKADTIDAERENEIRVLFEKKYGQTPFFISAINPNEKVDRVLEAALQHKLAQEQLPEDVEECQEDCPLT